LPDFAQALQDVVETFGVDVLVGHSFGAMTVARVAQNLPDLRAVVLISSPHTLEAVARGFCRNMRMNEEAEKGFFHRLQVHTPRPLAEESVTHYFKSITCPVLLQHDEEDDVIPVSTSKLISEAENAELLLTRGLGHRQIIRDRGLADKSVAFLARFVNL
jgi:pimeloyl-ACP methyl ester carboxylesterase